MSIKVCKFATERGKRKLKQASSAEDMYGENLPQE